MSKDFLCVVVILFACMICTLQWHKDTNKQQYALQLESDVYIMNVLGQKLAAKDRYIQRLESIIRTRPADTI